MYRDNARSNQSESSLKQSNGGGGVEGWIEIAHKSVFWGPLLNLQMQK